MSTQIPGLQALYARQVQLHAELASVNQEIISTIISAGNTPQPQTKGSKKAAKPAPAKKGEHARRKWFDAGESVALMRKALKKPLRGADLIRAVLASKGYTKDTLSEDDYKRVSLTLYQAINYAVEKDLLKKSSTGLISKGKA